MCLESNRRNLFKEITPTRIIWCTTFVKHEYAKKDEKFLGRRYLLLKKNISIEFRNVPTHTAHYLIRSFLL